MLNITGTWILVSMDSISSDGQMKEIYGKDPFGIAIFDEAGYLNMQLGSKNRKLFNSDALNKGTCEEVMNAFNSYMAFYGKYSEKSPGILSVKLEGSLFPNWQGKEIIRYVEIADNTMFLTTPQTKLGSNDVVVKAKWRKY